MALKNLSVILGGTFVILGFLIYFVSKGNYEFLGYAFVVGLLFSLIIFSDKYAHYPKSVLWFFVGWIFLHFSGGAFYFNGVRLYDIVLIDLVGEPFNFLKYDQLIHAYCYFAISLIVYFLAKRKFKTMDLGSCFFVVLAAFGVGGLNEIVEFGMVIWLNAAEAVGGYYNTMMDIVMNLVGSVLGVLAAKKIYP